MPSLADLFTPTFFIFLGVLLLVISVFVIYFENRMREQNHKIASMLSLVSTLAEDMNNVKMGFNHLATGGSGFSGSGFAGSESNGRESTGRESTDTNYNNKLITVSDGEYGSEDYNSDNSDNSDNIEADDNSESNIDDVENETQCSDEADCYDETESFDESEDSVNDEEANNEFLEADIEILEELTQHYDSNLDESNSDIKVLKLDTDHSNQITEIDAAQDLESLDGELLNVDNQLDSVVDEQNVEPNDTNSQELKTIKIDLGDDGNNLEESESHTESIEIDYKKLSLNKLRNIVSERGLSSDSFKLKKHELLKLLESE
jgi:hypothetical protein